MLVNPNVAGQKKLIRKGEYFANSDHPRRFSNTENVRNNYYLNYFLGPKDPQFLSARGEPIVPDFTISVCSSSCTYLRLFFFSIYFMTSLPALVMIARKRTQTSEKKAEREIIALTAGHRNCQIPDYLTHLRYFSLYIFFL